MDTASTLRHTFSSSGYSPQKEISFQKKRISVFEPHFQEIKPKTKHKEEVIERRKGKSVIKGNSFQIEKILGRKLGKEAKLQRGNKIKESKLSISRNYPI